MSDIQIQTILKKAITLRDNLQDKLTRKVLEVDVSAESSKYETLLSRTIRSLEQYVNKEKSLTYIGFVGHYSSGKSSTLNNIFEFYGTNNERSTGLNPTDKAITLITHPSNSKSLVLMSREGSNVPVRTLFINHPLLKNVVISDTPGSGDPHIVNEMIQDFLPICDSIFYFISATNPIDQADLPLLIQKSEKLPFIPIRYVITRSDEFRLNRNKELSESNINQSSVDQFKGQLIARVNEIFPNDLITDDDLLLIDNKDKFNIDNLRSIISTSIDEIDQEELFRIHGYKIEYYRKNLNEIYLYFLDLIKVKVAKSEGYETTALENINRFDKNAQINNDKLKFLWASSLNSVNEVFSDEELIVEDFSSMKQFQLLSITREFVEVNNIIHQRVKELSNGYHGKIVFDVNDKLRGLIRSEKIDFIEKLNTVDFMRADISDSLPAVIDFKIPSINTEIDLTKLNNQFKEFDKKVLLVSESMRQEVLRKSDILSKLIKGLSTATVYQKEYNTGFLILNENFDQYFDLIQMYKGTVLTRNNKETIEKLRIGTQLDELDQEFDESFMEEMKSKVLNRIYIPLSEEMMKVRESANRLSSMIVSIRLNVKKLKIDISEPPHQLGLEIVELEDSIDDFIDRKIGKSNSYLQEKLNTFYESHADSYSQHVTERTKLLENRKKSILLWTVSCAFVLPLLILGFYFGGAAPAASYTDAIIASIAANVIGGIVGNIYSKYKNNPDKIKTNSDDEFVSQQKNKIETLLSDQLWEEYKDLFDQDVTLSSASEIRSRFQSVSAHWRAENKSELMKFKSQLQVLFNELTDVAKEYFDTTNVFHKKYKAVFINAESNSNVVQKVTQEIKDASIRPSFDLLSETTNSLIEVKEKIQLISKG
jgi:predicted GTPase